MANNLKKSLVEVLKGYLIAGIIVVALITIFYRFVINENLFYAFKEGVKSTLVIVLAAIINIIRYSIKDRNSTNVD